MLKISAKFSSSIRISSTTQNIKIYFTFHRHPRPVLSNGYHLRHFYIIAVTRVFYVNKFKKRYIERCDINDEGCSHNDEVDASTPGHRHLPRQFIPYFLAHRLARKT